MDDPRLKLLFSKRQLSVILVEHPRAYQSVKRTKIPEVICPARQQVWSAMATGPMSSE